jgi:hypothetical protein
MLAAERASALATTTAQQQWPEERRNIRGISLVGIFPGCRVAHPGCEVALAGAEPSRSNAAARHGIQVNGHAIAFRAGELDSNFARFLRVLTLPFDFLARRRAAQAASWLRARLPFAHALTRGLRRLAIVDLDERRHPGSSLDYFPRVLTDYDMALPQGKARLFAPCPPLA